MTASPWLPEVKAQYESLPYPPRDPADERRRLVHSVPASLLAINHHCFRGRRDFCTGFRVLVAGGGTGDAVIFLAEQLRDFDAEVVYLDMSRASREVAEARARVRGLTNITWVSASILELPALGLGHFDYIECTGVLHHLESTEAGLAALNGVLREDGAIFLMLYAKYGRQAIYDMQALLRRYLPADAGIPEKVRLARALIAALPASNAFRKEMDAWGWEISAEGFGDAGLYDLLLHSQDRCFDVPGLYALAASAGLQLLDFAWRAADYEPANLVTDPAIRERLAGFDRPRRQALAELLVGNLRTHEFFLAREAGRSATLDDGELALCAYGPLLPAAPGLAAREVAGPGDVLRLEDRGQAFEIPWTPVARLVFGHLDGCTPLAEVRRRLRAALPGAGAAAMDRELESLYGTLHARGWLYLIRAGDYGVTVPDYARVFGRRP